jgi:hypothetical protein
MMKLVLGRNIGLAFLLILISIYSVAGQDEWIPYIGHNFELEYPSSWGLIDNPTGVLVGNNESPCALSINMHKEGCYPLSQHPLLMDMMLKLWKNQMLDGSTPWGDPIIEYSETILGPYSIGSQAYKNPDQFLICEIQGYTAENVTLTFAYMDYNPHYADGERISLDLARIKKSVNVTLSGNHTSYI